MIELYKDGDHMAILTDEKGEGNFIGEMSVLLSNMIEDGHHMVNEECASWPKDKKDKFPEIEGGIFGNDWAFQLACWLPQIVDICCKYRGYKNNVHEKRVLIAGNPGLNGMNPVASTREMGMDGAEAYEEYHKQEMVIE